MSTPPVSSPSQPRSNASGDDPLKTQGYPPAPKDPRTTPFAAYNLTQETGYPPTSDDAVYNFGRPVPENGVDYSYPRRRAIMAVSTLPISYLL